MTRFAVDTGGTFTDLVIEDDDGHLESHKSATTPADPVQGILDVFAVAAEVHGRPVEDLLGSGSVLIHGTTRGLNAVLTGNAARTGLLATEGHPDLLLLREGGRSDIFDLSIPYPEPYIPRSLTYEVPERISSTGDIVKPLVTEDIAAVFQEMRDAKLEAVAVCLLWSIANPAHELRLGELLEEELSGIPFTLSHQLNPCIREYRRASSAAIDASLKPVMTDYIGNLRDRLQGAGFLGRLLVVTSAGGALDAAEVAAAPIHALNSGPSMAPVAGRQIIADDPDEDMAIVADTGGTSYDVSVVRHGRIPWTRESWIGKPYFGHMTGFPSVDVRSVGAGGGSIASVDAGGLLRVGPESAAADPGPVCYGKGGTRPTVTDACLALGLLDPDYFLGGRRTVDLEAAREALEREVGDPLGLDVLEAAAAVLRVATERMVSAIEEITIHEGIDPTRAALIGGGGAAGFNTVAIGRQLGCRKVIVPPTGPVLSASGAIISELTRSFEIVAAAENKSFDFDGINAVLEQLGVRAQEFIDGPGGGSEDSVVEYSVEARYPHQVWELEVPLCGDRIADEAALRALCDDFHATHRHVFAVADENSGIEFQSWHGRAACRLAEPSEVEAVVVEAEPVRRDIYLPGAGAIQADVWRLESVPVARPLVGPAIVESETTTVMIDPGVPYERRADGALHMDTAAKDGQQRVAASNHDAKER